MAKTYFDQITASPEALAAFLASIPALDITFEKKARKDGSSVLK